MDTSKGKPGSRDSLEELRAALMNLTARGTKTPDWRERMTEDIASISRFQFGDAGAHLTEGTQAFGRWPGTKIVRSGTQLGAMSQRRGMISLTLAGAAKIASEDVYCVEIDDFVPKGNLFAVGVEDATDDIRIGDDVAIRHGADVRAVGVARMTPVEMRSAERGEAVHVRHCAR